MDINKIKDNLPISTSAGSSTIVYNKKVILPYPATRGEGRDNTLFPNARFKNGINFDCYRRGEATYGSMSTFRNKIKGNNASTNLIKQFANTSSVQEKGYEHIGNILMPMSLTDEDTLNHNFNTNKISNVERGGGWIGAASPVMSDMVAGIIDKAGGNFLADKGEQLYQVARNTYAGAENRQRTYTWEIEPENAVDYMQLLKICNYFKYRSLGEVNTSSQTVRDLGDKLKSTSQQAQDKILGSWSQGQTIIPAAVDFISKAMTVSNPDIWMISKYGTNGNIPNNDFFGPAQIKTVSVNSVTGATFQGLKSAPNLPKRLRITITFIELITLDRSNF